MVVYILSGPTCAGKSTFAKKLGLPIVSCDSIRKKLFGSYYKFSIGNEKIVWDTFYKELEIKVMFNVSFICDNTNCKEVYINKIISTVNFNGYKEIRVKFFTVPTWKLYLRNYWRYITTGKWIPISVMKSMIKNYNNLDKRKYAKYIFV